MPISNENAERLPRTPPCLSHIVFAALAPNVVDVANPRIYDASGYEDTVLRLCILNISSVKPVSPTLDVT